jgi:hypothetical protein
LDYTQRFLAFHSLLDLGESVLFLCVSDMFLIVVMLVIRDIFLLILVVLQSEHDVLRLRLCSVTDILRNIRSLQVWLYSFVDLRINERVTLLDVLGNLIACLHKC